MKRCKTLHQPCPNDPVCKGCDALDQRNSDSSCAGVDMAPSWRDYVRLVDVVGALLVIVFAGWLSQFAPVALDWLKGLI